MQPSLNIYPAEAPAVILCNSRHACPKKAIFQIQISVLFSHTNYYIQF